MKLNPTLVKIVRSIWQSRVLANIIQTTRTLEELVKNCCDGGLGIGKSP